MTSSRANRARRRDDGFALTEVVVSIALVGTVVAAILTGLVTVTKASRVHREEVSLDYMLRSSAEVLLSQATPYTDCATTTSYASSLPIDPEARITVTISEVEVWNGMSPPSFQVGCVVDPGATRITIQASTNNGNVEELQVVKRRSSS